MSPLQAGNVAPLLRQGEILFDNFPLSCGVNESASGGLIKERENVIKGKGGSGFGKSASFAAG